MSNSALPVTLQRSTVCSSDWAPLSAAWQAGTSSGKTAPSFASWPSPHWQTLPEEARVTLTELMIRLILDHAAGAQAPRRTEAGHEA